MKFTITADCTPAEARAFLGLPDLEPLHAVYVSRTEDWLRGQGIVDLVRGFGGLGAGLGAMPGGVAGAGAGGPSAAARTTEPAAIIEQMVRRWAPLGEAGMSMMQTMLSQMAGAAMAGGGQGAPGTPGTPGGRAPADPPGTADEPAAHPS